MSICVNHILTFFKFFAQRYLVSHVDNFHLDGCHNLCLNALILNRFVAKRCLEWRVFTKFSLGLIFNLHIFNSNSTYLTTFTSAISIN